MTAVLKNAALGAGAQQIMRAAHTPTIAMKPEGDGIHPTMASQRALH